MLYLCFGTELLFNPCHCASCEVTIPVGAVDVQHFDPKDSGQGVHTQRLCARCASSLRQAAKRLGVPVLDSTDPIHQKFERQYDALVWTVSLQNDIYRYFDTRNVRPMLPEYPRKSVFP